MTLTSDAGPPAPPHPAVDRAIPVQPVGVGPWPTGMLVLPDDPRLTGLAETLVAGRDPGEDAAAVPHLRPALAADWDAARDAVTGDDLLARYHRALLSTEVDPVVWTALADDSEHPSSDPDLAVLIATARHDLALTPIPPDADAAVRPEVRAVALASRAGARLSSGDIAGAVGDLAVAADAADAAPSPVLAATLRATRADLLREHLDDAAGAIAEVDRALLVAGGADLAAETVADLRLTRGLARQTLAADGRPELLTAAVADLVDALTVFREDSHPELFALGNTHLGIAYLTLPMSDKADRIRLGVAVTCLRGALRVWTPQRHPGPWASATLNLANALQYLPSAHPRDNLEEAVDLYEQVLAVRDEIDDPAGVARILANQGNALGHLGAVVDARERLTRAGRLFEAAGDAEGVEAVGATLSVLADLTAE